jgi:carbamoyl-phosphate synthase small subunit
MIDSGKPVAKLALEDGNVFTGLSLGATGESFGEVVFNTSMTGYQEILTDPSYRGQIVTMTYPQIGNYGVNNEDVESWKPHLAGFVVRQSSQLASNFRLSGSLDDYMRDNGIVGISEIDTRKLTRIIRDKGAMRAVLSTVRLDDSELVAAAKNSPGLVGRDLVREVLPDRTSNWTEPLDLWWSHSAGERYDWGDVPVPHLVAMDFGMKRNIARHLRQQGFRVTVVPGTLSAADILQLSPDGLFLSNGPGDPEPLTWAIDTIRELMIRLPVFGICLGHQLLALACGAKTFKLKFGHRGANQPVIDCQTGRIEITSQNHGFAVEESTLPDCLEITHRHLNDDTIAGLKHKSLPALSVQYHPEASAGPHDSHYLFVRFRELVARHAVSSPTAP